MAKRKKANERKPKNIAKEKLLKQVEKELEQEKKEGE